MSITDSNTSFFIADSHYEKNYFAEVSKNLSEISRYRSENYLVELSK